MNLQKMTKQNRDRVLVCPAHLNTSYIKIKEPALRAAANISAELHYSRGGRLAPSKLQRWNKNFYQTYISGQQEMEAASRTDEQREKAGGGGAAGVALCCAGKKDETPCIDVGKSRCLRDLLTTVSGLCAQVSSYPLHPSIQCPAGFNLISRLLESTVSRVSFHTVLLLWFVISQTHTADNRFFHPCVTSIRIDPPEGRLWHCLLLPLILSLQMDFVGPPMIPH